MWVSQERVGNRPADIPYIRVPKVLDIGPKDPELLYVVPSNFALWDDNMQAVEGPYKNAADHRALLSGMALGHTKRTGEKHLIVKVGQNGRDWIEPILPGQCYKVDDTHPGWGEF